MTEIHIKLDPDKVTLWDMEQFEGDGKRRWTWIVDLLSRMAHDEHGVPLPYEDAKSEIRKLTLPQANHYVQQLLESASVPKVTDTA